MSPMSLTPNSTAVNGAPSHKRVSRSTSASAPSTSPSTAGAAATTAIDRANPEGVGPRSATTTSARGPGVGSAIMSVGSIIECREQPRET